MSDEDFATLIARVRDGDEDAAARLLRRYEPLIRKAIHDRLQDPTARRLEATTGIFNQVMFSFVAGARGDKFEKFDLNDPNQLRRLLLGMARNKVLRAIRDAHTQQNDPGATVALDDVPVPAANRSPSEAAAMNEDFARVRREFSADDWPVVELYFEGYTWAEIAERLSGTTDARRMQFKRAMDAVRTKLRLDDCNA